MCVVYLQQGQIHEEGGFFGGKTAGEISQFDLEIRARQFRKRSQVLQAGDLTYHRENIHIIYNHATQVRKSRGFPWYLFWG